MSFTRAPNGALTPQGCFSNAALAGCTTLSGQLNFANSVTVSPDGASVYAASVSSGTVVSFTRAPNGALTPQGCFSNAALAGCTTLSGQLSGANSVTVSPDGASVYAASTVSNTVVSFTRAPNGALTPQGCFSNAALAGCTTLSGQLDGARSVTVSPDGASVYATSAGSGTVVSFTRAANGALTPQGCFSNAALAGCTTLSGQLGGARSVTVSPDGASVYAAADASHTVVSFTRAPNGALTPQGCFSNAALAGCTTLSGQLSGANSVTVSPDGASVYAASLFSGTVVSFTRELAPVCRGTTSSGPAGATQTLVLDCPTQTASR